MHWMTHEFALPILPKEYDWKIAYATRPRVEDKQAEEMPDSEGQQQKKVLVAPRSVLVLIGKKTEKKNESVTTF